MPSTASTAVEQVRPLVVPTQARRSLRRFIGPTLRYALLIPLALLFLFPFYLIVRNALMTQPEITAPTWSWWADSTQWNNFNVLFDNPEVPMARSIRNSAILAGVNLVLQTFFASMAGYALARIYVRGRDLVFFLILSTLMIPSAVTFIPSYVVVSELGGVNTLWGIVVPGLFNAFATFLFRQFYLDFPVEIEEAGRLDGLGYFGIYRGLILPNSLGIMAALGILSFIYSWNAFLTAQTINLPMLFMGAAVACAPLVIVFLIMQRYIVQGVRMSGIKG
jgi:multiple sugar transport system permease protein